MNNNPMYRQQPLSGIPLDRNLTITELQQICHQRSRSAGWWDDYLTMPDQYRKYFLSSRYALIHSEVTEALEGLRRGAPDSHLPARPAEEVELADTIIRIMDYAGAMNMDLIGAIVEKLRYNASRLDHTAEARAAQGGKAL